MLTPRYRTPLPLRFGKRVSRLLLIVLAAIILFQVLPFTLLPAPLPGPSAGPGPAAFFEPLQVCSNSGDLVGFLADHPWVSGAEDTAEFFPGQEFRNPPAVEKFTEGHLSKVFRPPRPSLS